MSILYKEEVKFTCHSLVVMVWCSAMMETVVREVAGRWSWLWTSRSTQWSGCCSTILEEFLPLSS